MKVKCSLELFTRNQGAYTNKTQKFLGKSPIGKRRHKLSHLHYHEMSFYFFNVTGKESAYNAKDVGDASSIPGLGRCPWRKKWQPTQYSCLKNLMDGVTKSQT